MLLNDANGIYLGAQQVKDVYCGSDLVWSAIEPFFVDFSEYDTGSAPSGWTLHSSNANYNVISDGSAVGGQALRHNARYDDIQIPFTWDAPGVFVDFDMTGAVANFDTNGTNRTWGGFIYRFSGSPSSANYYQTEISRIGGTPHFRLRRLENQSVNSRLSNEEDSTDMVSPITVSSHSQSEYWNIRTVFENGTIRAKFWDASDPEPNDFQVDIVDSDPLPAGHVGVNVSYTGRDDLDARWSYLDLIVTSR